MVEERDLACPRQVTEADRILGRGMTERAFGLHFLGTKVRVMDQEIGVQRQAEGSLVVLADSARARTERGRAMVRDVGDRGVLVADAAAGGAP